MQRRIEVVEGTRAGDQGFRGRGVGDSRICERGIGQVQRIQAPNPLVIGDCQQNDVAALFGAANGKDSNPRRCGGQRAAVGISLAGVDELSGRAGNSSEERARRRDGGGCRKVGNPGREKTRFSGGLGNFLYGTGLRAVGSDPSCAMALPNAATADAPMAMQLINSCRYDMNLCLGSREYAGVYYAVQLKRPRVALRLCWSQPAPAGVTLEH